MTDDERLELDDACGIVEGSGARSDVVDLDGLDTARAGFPADVDLVPRASSWRRVRLDPATVGAVAVLVLVGGLYAASTTRESSQRRAPPVVEADTPGSDDARSQTSQRAASLRHAVVFRDPANGALVIAFSPAT